MSEKPHFSMKDTTLTVMLGVGFSLLVAVALIPSKPIDNIERPRHLTADIPQEYQDFTATARKPTHFSGWDESSLGD